MKNAEVRPKPSLINRAQVRRMALSLAETTRGRRFNRVSRKFTQECELHLEAYIRYRVDSAPSLGVTL